ASGGDVRGADRQAAAGDRMQLDPADLIHVTKVRDPHGGVEHRIADALEPHRVKVDGDAGGELRLLHVTVVIGRHTVVGRLIGEEFVVIHDQLAADNQATDTT